MDSIPVEIEGQAQPPDTKKQSFASKLLNRANDALGDLDDSIQDSSKPKGRGRPKKVDLTQETQEQFSNLVASLIALVVAGLNAPEQVKPNFDEINAVTNYSIRILLRHVPMTGKMSADAMDVIGIIAVISGYYARVAPAMREYKNSGETKPPDGSYSEQYDKWVSSAPGESDPIADASPEAGDFLNKAHAKGIQRDNNSG